MLLKSLKQPILRKFLANIGSNVEDLKRRMVCPRYTSINKATASMFFCRSVIHQLKQVSHLSNTAAESQAEVPMNLQRRNLLSKTSQTILMNNKSDYLFERDSHSVLPVLNSSTSTRNYYEIKNKK